MKRDENNVTYVYIYIEDLEEATVARVEEEDRAESLKKLQENVTLSKSEWK
jgi:hypothetical protein